MAPSWRRPNTVRRMPFAQITPTERRSGSTYGANYGIRKMTFTSSIALKLGSRAPDLTLPDTQGREVSLKDFDHYTGLLVIFMCNHCPYVKHIDRALADFARRNEPQGVTTVGVNANDASTHPADSLEKMVEEVQRVGYGFPYLHDESQEVAKAFGAVCTPDFFLFDKSRRLVYRGQFDDSRPGSSIAVTGKDLQAAVNSLLDGDEISGEQQPSVGCSIKWKPKNAPH
jgi:peroxiredoxin